MKLNKYRLNDGVGFTLVASGLNEKLLIKKMAAAIDSARRSKIEFKHSRLNTPERRSWTLELADLAYKLR